MSRHNLTVPMTPEMKKFLELRYKISTDTENVHMAWGLDHDGYFIQLWIEDAEGEDLYIEDGLIGTSKNRIIEKMERHGILDFIRKNEKKKFDCLVLDLPF